MSTLAVKPMRKDLDDFGASRLRAEGGRRQEKQQWKKRDSAHEFRVGAAADRFNIELPVNYLFFSSESGTMPRSRA